MHTVRTHHTLGDMSGPARTGMFRLRHETFVDRLGWVEASPDGMERDAFDDLPSVKYIVATSPAGDVDACWRLLPTLGPYMLGDVSIFQQLMHGQPVPHAQDTWELSRFAVASDRLSADESAGNHQLGFGQLSVSLMAESVRFAQQNDIARYITVTNVAIERLLKRLGLNIHRAGPPIRIGNVLTVALFIEIDDITAGALGV